MDGKQICCLMWGAVIGLFVVATAISHSLGIPQEESRGGPSSPRPPRPPSKVVFRAGSRVEESRGSPSSPRPPRPPSKEESRGSPSSPRPPSRVDAFIMAQQFVRRGLRSPGTANFGSIFSDYQSTDDVVTSLGGGHFRVQAWVDSQNAFGATVRNHFVCEVEHVGDDRWRLKSLVFAE